MKTKTPYVKILHLLFLYFFLTGTDTLFAQHTGIVTGIPTFHSIGIYWSGSGGNASTVCNVKYRVAGSGAAWIEGYPLWFDSRAAGSGTTAARPANEYRGSLVNLAPNTVYEIELSLQGTPTLATTTCQTWSETFPAGNTITVTNSSSQLNITTSGTATGYQLYTPASGQTATIDAANTADNCIYINASYIVIRGLILKGARTDAIKLGPNAHDVVIEKCDISGWGRPGVDLESGVKVDNQRTVSRIIIQRNKIHHPRGNSNTWATGHPYGPQAVGFVTAGGNHVIRYNEVYSDDTHYFSDGIGGLDNFTFEGFPRADSDIYGNEVSQCWDDGIEAEGGNCNVRIWGNFIDNTFTGIATAANSVGPMYVFRNVTYVGRRLAIGASTSSLDIEDRGPFNKCGSQSSAAIGGKSYFFHNTILQPTQSGFSNTRGFNGGIIDNGGGPLRNTFSRNNIWQTAYTGQGGLAIAEYQSNSGTGCSYDYDLCNSSLSLNNGIAGSHIITGAPAYAAGTPVAPLVLNAGPRAAGFELSSTSRGYNEGVILPGFNDGFNATAPDIGAYESGKPLLEFGIEAYIPATPTNQPPAANAGSSITLTLPVNFTALTGSGSDPDGTISSYVWSRVSGPATFTFGTANAATTTLSNLIQGTYVFRLTVTDNGGMTATDDITIIVNPALNLAPTANAGNNITLTLPINSSALAGSGADADGTITSYAWTRVSGPPTFILGTTNAATTIVSGLVHGIYTFRLTVTDNNGATGTDDVIVTVNAAPNQIPTANAGNNIVTTLPVNYTTLTGSGTDADGTISSYVWTSISGPATFTFGSANAATTTLSNLVQGNYIFRLTVTDNNGATATDDINVTVNAAIPVNQAPVANAGSNIVINLPASSTTLNGSNSIDPDGTITGYSWTYISGPATYSITNATAATTTLTGLVQGTYAFRLTVTDNGGATDIDNIVVTVNAAANQVPAANAGNNIVITLPVNSTTLAGSGADIDGTIVSYVWSRVSGPATFTFGTPNAATTTLSGLAEGTYVFRMTVTDNNGAAGTDEVNIIVNPAPVPNQAPVARAGDEIVIMLPVNYTTLNGNTSTDPDGVIVSYAWSRVSGPTGYTFTSAGSIATGLNNLVQGAYVFRLTVTDNNGVIATDNVTVTVNAPLPGVNQAPIARTGNDILLTLPVNSVSLSGVNSTDTDGSIVGYEWTQLSGPSPAIIGNRFSAASSITGLTTGEYMFSLKVTDNDGASSTAIIKVTVRNNSGNSIFLNIYPNPASGNLTIQYFDAANGLLKISVYDATRRLVMDETADKTQVVFTKTLDVNILNTGTYILQVVLPDGNTVAKQFIKK